MKLCRYDDDRLGVVRGDMVHDVTEAQTADPGGRALCDEGRRGDRGAAAWRSRLEEMAAKAPGKPVSQVKLLSPVARPSKLRGGADQLQAHIEEMRSARDHRRSIDAARADDREGRPLPEGELLDGRPFARASRSASRTAATSTRSSSRSSSASRAATSRRRRPLDYVAGYCIGLDMTARGQEDRSFRKSIDGYSVLGPWLVTADEIADPDDVPLTIFSQRRGQAEQQHQAC